MKKYITKTKTIQRFRVWRTACLFAFLGFMGLQNAYAQYTQIPDANFEQALYNQGIDNVYGDLQVLTSAISGLTYLDVNNSQILDLTGIQEFTSLQTLICDHNYLQFLDVSGLSNLQSLNCSYNLGMTSLNFNGLNALTDLNCSYSGLSTIDATGLTSLETLNCSNNQMSSVIVSGLTNLVSLNCAGHFDLTSINITALPSLESLHLQHCQLTSLDVSGLSALTNLECYSNRLTNLNVSGLSSLSRLDCGNNLLQNLDLTGLQSLFTLNCSGNSLQNLDVSASPALFLLFCGVNQLTNLNISGLTNIEFLYCNNNQLSSLNLTALNALTYLNCSFNLIPCIIVSNPVAAAANVNYTEDATSSYSVDCIVPPAPTAGSQSFCNGATVANLTATGTALQWYNNQTGGSGLPMNTILATATYYVSQTVNGLVSPRTGVAITVNPSTTTTFTAVAPICYGDSLADLPTTSLEGITGTWSPAINKLATTTYTFTPDAGLCATAAVMTIIVHQTNPPYTVAQSFCSGATIESLYYIGTDVSWYTVPTGGTALIPGTYLASGNYYASQTLNGCESDRITTTVTVNPNVMPSFNQVAAICVGDTLAPLPTTSNNGITGTWSPALNNLATTTYEFTVDAGQCSEKGIMTIIVNPAVTPTFSQVPAICAGDTLAALPTTSNEGITGTWSPVLNNLATTSYVFTPNAGQCATTASITITVNPIVTPTFTQVAPICTGGFLANLPTASINGLVGSWFPAISNLQTTTYTFTPKKEQQCATTATMTVTVNPNVTPLFTQIAPIFCSGATLAPLPTTSINGVNGSWSPAMNNLATTTYTFTPNAGQCASTVTMTIVVQTVGTITGGNVTVCAPGTALDLNGVATVFTNSTTLTFNGNPAGSTIQWQRSSNYINTTGATPSWSAVANTATINNNVLINGNTLTISNLTSTIWYRVRVTNGSCFTYTVPVKVGVTPLARAGAITSPSSVCAGGNITFTSAAYTGSAIAWEVSTTSATAGFSIVAGANGLSFTMLNAPSTRFYVRAIVTSGACSMARSAVRTITVSPRSVGGTITGGGTVCSGANKMLRITGSTGSIQWMYSTDAINFVNVPTAPTVAPTFSTTSISGTASTYVVNNITGLTYFKAVVRSGVCFSKDSNTVKYVVATAATAGTATASASSVCPNTATTIDLVGSAGDIIWQRSTNPTAINPTWVNIAGAVSPTLNTGNLTVTTAFRARITIGNCAPIVSSNVVLVTINCATGSKQIETVAALKTPFEVTAYPNPSNNVFNFKVNGADYEAVSVLVFDMTGRQVDSKVVNASDIENLALGQNYSSGVYNVIVSQGMNTKTVRLVKK